MDHFRKPSLCLLAESISITAPAKKGDYDKVTELAKLYVEKVAEARK